MAELTLDEIRKKLWEIVDNKKTHYLSYYLHIFFNNLNPLQS